MKKLMHTIVTETCGAFRTTLEPFEHHKHGSSHDHMAMSMAEDHPRGCVCQHRKLQAETDACKASTAGASLLRGELNPKSYANAMDASPKGHYCAMSLLKDIRDGAHQMSYELSKQHHLHKRRSAAESGKKSNEIETLLITSQK